MNGWANSAVVLDCFRGQGNYYKVFVTNRIKNILEKDWLNGNARRQKRIRQISGIGVIP